MLLSPPVTSISATVTMILHDHFEGHVWWGWGGARNLERLYLRDSEKMETTALHPEETRAASSLNGFGSSFFL